MVIHVRVPIESFILEKVLKFAQQFFRPGKSLENGDKVWKDGIKSYLYLSCILFATHNTITITKKYKKGKKKWQGYLKETIKLMLIRSPQLQFF